MRDAPEVRRLADSLRLALVGERIIRFYTAWRKLQRSGWPGQLPGRLIVDVRSVGKNLLLYLEGELVLYSHLGHRGRWEVQPRGRRVGRDHRVKVSLTTDHWRTQLYHGTIFEILHQAALATHHVIRRLGPCVLAEPFDAQLFLHRLRQQRHAMREIADVLFDHEVVTGIGNCLKSEVLFAARISPFSLVGRLPAEARQRLCHSLPAISQHAYRFAGRTVLAADLGLEEAAKGDPVSLRDHYVYGHAHVPCLHCQTPIQRARHGLSARLTFYCPVCQPRTEASDLSLQP